MISLPRYSIATGSTARSRRRLSVVRVSTRLVRQLSRRNGGRLRRALSRSRSEGRPACGSGDGGLRAALATVDIPPSCLDPCADGYNARAASLWERLQPRSPCGRAGGADRSYSCSCREGGARGGSQRGSVELQRHVAGKGFDGDRPAAGAVAVLEAGAGAHALAHDVGTGGVDVAAEGLGLDAGRAAGRQRQADVAADRFEAEAAAVGHGRPDAGIARHRAALQPRQALAAGVDIDVARHRFHVDMATDAAAQGDLAADALDIDLVAVEVELQVTADAFDAGLARRADRGHPTADAVDLQLIAGHALDIDAGRDRIHVKAGLARDFQHQGGGFAVAAVARIAHAHRQLAAAVVDLQALDAVAQASGDADFVAVPGADLDLALEVGDLDFAACVERAGFVDRG